MTSSLLRGSGRPPLRTSSARLSGAVPHTRMRAADRVMTIETGRTIDRRTFAYRRKTNNRFRRPLIIRHRASSRRQRRHRQVQQQRTRHHAAATLEHVDAEIRSCRRQTDAQGRRRRLRDTPRIGEEESQSLALLRGNLKPSQALVARCLRPEQKRARAVGPQHLLGCPPRAFVFRRTNDDYARGIDACACKCRRVSEHAAALPARCIRRWCARRFSAGCKRRISPMPWQSCNSSVSADLGHPPPGNSWSSFTVKTR